jgi:DNA repair protein RadC
MRDCEVLNSPQVVRDFLWVKLGALEHEVFAVIHLDAQNRVIEYVEMFRGTVSQTSVYPREVVKESLARNSAALLLVHNHPSGSTQPSRADELLTQALKSALLMIEAIWWWMASTAARTMSACRLARTWSRCRWVASWK